ncbi:hypothetical protein ACH5GD_001795 [Campylobacter coli]
MEKSKKERIEKLSEKTKNLNLDNELYIFVNNIKWGKKANILINCVDLGTNIEFYFSVFFSSEPHLLIEVGASLLKPTNVS